MNRAQRDARKRAKLERLWREGLTAREIAKAMGWTAKEPSAVIAIYRSRGFDLPHRYPQSRRPPAGAGSPRRARA